MINFATLKGLTIPEGVVTQIARDGVVLWKLETSKPIVLEVEKMTSDTYANETAYTGEEFILLDIYPKTNGTVSVTYGGLTKTITDTSGVEEPNAQQVFFGTFNGVSDSVATPTSGTLTIEGDVNGFAVSAFQMSKLVGGIPCRCITGIESFGNISHIRNSAFYQCDKIVGVTIPSTIIAIGHYAFNLCRGLTNVKFSNGLKTIGNYAFNNTNIESVEIPRSVISVGARAFYMATNYEPELCELKNVKMLPTTPPTLEYMETTSENDDGTTTTTKFWENFGNHIEKIVVPIGCGTLYKSNSTWIESGYANYVVEES